jgi:hypothetical protein
VHADIAAALSGLPLPADAATADKTLIRRTVCETKHDQVLVVFEELQNFLGPLLLKRRSGILAALVAACGRAGVCQREVCGALAKALAGLPQWQGREGERDGAAIVCWDACARARGGRAPAACDGSAIPSTPSIPTPTSPVSAPPPPPSPGTAFLAPALMTLDTAAVLGGQDGQAGGGGDDGSIKLSTPGCALLAAILGFPKVGRPVAAVAVGGGWRLGG